MDIEKTSKNDRKALEMIHKGGNNENNAPSKENVNKSTIFDFLYFWSIFLLSLSFFSDLCIYFCFYQEKNNQWSYNSLTFFLRIITDSLYIAPLLIYIRYALTSSTKNYIIGVFIFLPQLILNFISILKIYTQSFITKENYENIENKSSLYSFNSFNSYNTTIEVKMTNAKVLVLKISPSFNLAIYLLAVILIFLKIFKNF